MTARLPFQSADLMRHLNRVGPPRWLADAKPGVQAGCFTGVISNEGYHSLRDSISRTGMSALLRSPEHYLRGERPKRTAPNFGSAFHALALEPEDFAREYVVYDGRRATNAYKRFAESNPGKQILTSKEYVDLVGMRQAVRRYRDFPIAEAVAKGVSEQTIVWTDPATGVRCRIRVDSLNPFAILDYKTCGDARPKSALRQAIDDDYDLQAYMYSVGVYAFTGKILPFMFIFVETSAPYGVWVHKASPSMLESGRIKFEAGVRAFRKLQLTGDVHGYKNAMSDMEWPRYAQVTEETYAHLYA